MYRLDITIPGLPKILANMKSRNWRASYFEKKKWMKLTCDHITAPLKPSNALTRASVMLIRNSSRQPDRDNLMSSWKAVIDGLVVARVLEDDNCDVIAELKSEWQKCRPKDSHIRIIVEELPTAEVRDDPGEMSA